MTRFSIILGLFLKTRSITTGCLISLCNYGIFKTNIKIIVENLNLTDKVVCDLLIDSSDNFFDSDGRDLQTVTASIYIKPWLNISEGLPIIANTQYILPDG